MIISYRTLSHHVPVDIWQVNKYTYTASESLHSRWPWPSCRGTTFWTWAWSSSSWKPLYCWLGVYCLHLPCSILFPTRSWSPAGLTFRHLPVIESDFSSPIPQHWHLLVDCLEPSSTYHWHQLYLKPLTNPLGCLPPTNRVCHFGLEGSTLSVSPCLTLPLLVFSWLVELKWLPCLRMVICWGFESKAVCRILSLWWLSR